MQLTQTLRIAPGVVACIGGGGKTSLMMRLSEELSKEARVIVCTTTHIHPPQNMPLLPPDAEAIQAALAAGSPVCVGERTQEGKLTLRLAYIPLLQSLSDYVLCEADGSRGLPLKAHAPHEPVIPAQANRVILVAGIDGIGKPISEAAHRPELYAAMLGVGMDHIVSPEDAARVINQEALHDTVFINKVETAGQLALAREMAACLHCAVVAGALRRRERELCLLS